VEKSRQQEQLPSDWSQEEKNNSNSVKGAILNNPVEDGLKAHIPEQLL
jgi:hypothetical protein